MVKKLSLLLLSIILIFGSYLPQTKSSAATDSITISTDSINIRSGPGLSYPLVTTAKRGEKYSIAKEKGEWIEIQLSAGKTGWVVNWLVTKENEKKDTTSTSKNTVAIANTAQLRVRSGPGTSFRVVGSLNKGQEVTILDQNENWYKTTSIFGEGWIAREFLDIQTGKQESTPSPSTANKTSTGIVTGDTLNVRKQPTTSSIVIGKLSKGASVKIISKQNNWFEISFSNNLTGWVSSEFIDSQTGSTKGTPREESSDIIGTITAGSLNVRSKSSLNSNIIGTVVNGQSFTILEEYNNWVKIEYKSGSFGWVAGWYLSMPTANIQSGQAVKESMITVLHNGTNIRKDPNVQANVVERANEGATFSVKSIKNDWYEIKLKNGKTAFIAGWIVSINGSDPQIEKSGAEGYLKNKTIVLDPGHGGGDNGATGTRGTLEKDLTLRTALLLYDKLKAAGANVYLTRKNDTFLSLSSRVSPGRSYNADAFISLHYDSDYDSNTRGMTGYYYHSYQKSLAESLYASTVGQTKLRNRGVRFGDYHVVRENSQKAVLMELGYLSSPEEETTLNSSMFQENVASGLFDGLARYFKGSL
ncbi:MAG: SH3 domain-containing protein [Bacillus sp. (in: Bacteria)]|nr:SH3 domain-containing protein [Bacillus sp. (in: firmicutes)]